MNEGTSRPPAGPLEAKTQRLLKLAVAIGAMREGAGGSGRPTKRRRR